VTALPTCARHLRKSTNASRCTMIMLCSYACGRLCPPGRQDRCYQHERKANASNQRSPTCHVAETHILSLPTEILQSIFGYLAPNTPVTNSKRPLRSDGVRVPTCVALVCKRFAEIFGESIRQSVVFVVDIVAIDSSWTVYVCGIPCEPTDLERLCQQAKLHHVRDWRIQGVSLQSYVAQYVQKVISNIRQNQVQERSVARRV